MTLPNIAAYDDVKLESLRIAVSDEVRRRTLLESIPGQVGSLNEKYLVAAGREFGADWIQPTGSFDAYPKDWVVADTDGKLWYSEIDSNTHKPPTNWRQVVGEGDAPPEWIQPSGAGGYDLGDTVTFEGKVYASTYDGKNVWSPTDYPAGWEEVI